ncbi:uncharacterized protein Z519_09959 [Cladophialophora bantiana CBS 173.52]|uniref:Cytochrome P450 monooxygenase n=1 Tax=Cladophialophora bantiana (strain ATCC 10958 / CBS 173.52 / CDC B-1940 / NIH 8579) TaxID=1442370 RepID=A0A0D2FR85_CLAB1|nr:uncharacterized protein Z519_09959 [Cladophialophora bantiana CBS 173.52]KIW89107.1 hypothetical protein Z519_09959 [Cladophialophora bantiana CBS 173.52]
MTATYLPLVVASAGVATHLFFFKVGEHWLYPTRYIQAFFLGCIVTIVARSHYGNIPAKDSLAFTAKYAALYLAGLYTSLITYRLFFNPLNKFPGPYWARLSRFDMVFRCAGKRNLHHHLLAMHQKYGKFVRLDSNSISVTHPDGVEVTSGVKSKCTKGDWYGVDLPFISMHTCRDRAQHDRRRRIWSPAFSDKALRGYENRVQKYNDLLIKKLEESNGQPMNMAKWFNLYSFDVMGDLAFGDSYQCLESGEMHWAIKLLNDGMDMIGFWLPNWFFRLLLSIPGAAADHWRFINYCCEQLDKRMKMQGKLENQDISHTLIEHFNRSDPKAQKAQLPMLQGDSRLIIVAGSDTTAATLVHLFYHIATEKGLIQRLREELDELVKSDEAIDAQKIQDAPLLNGSINETLRLNPPVPSGVFRKTPKEGVEIGGVYIPGDTVIQMPQYAMARDPDLYPSPLEFIPERHSSRPELMLHKDAFAPFSAGPYNCIGKNLAYMEIRLLTANIIRKFDVRLAEGETGQDLLMGTKDHFTLGLGPLRLCFEPRKL